MSPQNKMNAPNLAVVFGPTLCRSPSGLSGDLRDQAAQVNLVLAAITCGPGSVIDGAFTGAAIDGLAVILPTLESPVPKVTRGASMRTSLYSPAKKAGVSVMSLVTDSLMTDPRAAFEIFDEDRFVELN